MKLGSVDTHHNHTVLFEQTVHLVEAGTIVQAGHYEYDFELTLPATAPLTNAIPKAGDEVALVLYRYHAQVKIVGATEVGEGYGVLHVIEN
ncbi:hypothetical protein BCR33DRAFT_3355 [Rhizoclosmatium globosum]|uniref:Uncharacterized protein n=1 Tax=Rhizoclosmatium globosum TaxID=329046 RepID=A0A1Y2D2U3_9FUNG|nr:hypothetical protein BCR33DRAFT_3355 [Rhizoclosmatium globosum]|eukprot:ORY53570.1 hypothetical protein BCR33DRAFT_3355 [Rhizoclosmatium globosum]